MGAITLRRRLDPMLHVEVYEVKLGEDFLMSSLFTVAEIKLARLALAELPGTDLDVAVGGLGLGYTARAVLDDERVTSLLVVEALAEVISWHERRLLPDVVGLSTDRRTRFQRGDFFAMAESATGFDPTTPQRRFHAILLDVDHTPRHVLHPRARRLLQSCRFAQPHPSSAARRSVCPVVRRPTRSGLPGRPGRSVRRRARPRHPVPESDHRRRIREHGVHRQVMDFLPPRQFGDRRCETPRRMA